MGQYWQLVQIFIGFMSCYFRHLVHVAVVSIDLDIVAKSFPVLYSSNIFLHFFNIEVTCQWVVIVPTNQLSFNNFRNIGQVLIIKNSIGIFLLFIQFFCSYFSRLVIFCIQLYQPQFHAFNSSLIETFCYQFLTKSLRKLI